MFPRCDSRNDSPCNLGPFLFEICIVLVTYTDTPQRRMHRSLTMTIHISVSSTAVFGHTPQTDRGRPTPRKSRAAAPLAGSHQRSTGLMRLRSILPSSRTRITVWQPMVFTICGHCARFLRVGRRMLSSTYRTPRRIMIRRSVILFRYT
jgi:hypothetical protein